MSFIPLTPQSIVISSDSVVSTLWNNGQTILNNIYKESISTETKFLNIYDIDPNINNNAEINFSITYGNIYGSGSSPINPLIPENSLTRILYGQIRTLVNGDENTPINFGSGNTKSPDVYIININRKNYKEKLFTPTFNLHLSSSAGLIQLTTNVKDITNTQYTDTGRIFDIVSGSNGNSIITTTTSDSPGYTVSGSYGKFLPDVGLILINPRALSLPFVSGGLGLSVETPQSDIAFLQNQNFLYNYIKQGQYFSLNSEETVTSDYIFVRVNNDECNYTTNPTIINNSGEFYYNNLINNPQTYITTVGLYNDRNELLAVAKLSKPLKKDFTKEALLRVKLDF